LQDTDAVSLALRVKAPKRVFVQLSLAGCRRRSWLLRRVLKHAVPTK